MSHTIGKRFSFEAGHRLGGLPDGHKCARPHGHSYTVEVIVTARELTRPGFVTDFASLDPLKRHLAEVYDHRGVPELCSICPAAQANLCRAAHTRPSATQFQDLLAAFGYDSDFLIEDGHVWTHGLGEQRRYALQHALGYQVWELSQPRYLGAHGRSLTGHQPAQAEHASLAALREKLASQAQQGDD
jgi:hypothetical protein